VPQKTLKGLIDQVHFAMAVHDIRYYLNGILFVTEGKSLTLVATDGHRLALAQATLDVEMPKQEVILPRKTVLELQRLLKDGGSSDKAAEKAASKAAEKAAADGEAAPEAPAGAMIELRFAGNQAKFSFGGMEFVTKLVEGRFPDYNRVIPRNHRNHLTVGRAPLLASLQRAAILTSEKFKGVRMNFEAGVLRIASSNAEQEEAKEELEINYEGDAIEIGFNVTYLIDVLANLDGEMVTLSLQDTNSSALFSQAELAGFKYVVMPMRI
jgi:DNA polymerase-3 subunit beta